MTSGIPHSAIIKTQLDEYLKESVNTIRAACDEVPTMPEFRAIYKNSVGTFTPLTKLSHRQLPLLKTACGIVKRCPLLIATRQVQLAYVELRRLIEVITCYPYFSDHPVEWENFSSNPSDGFARDQEQPITWCAHREIRWYAGYIKERYREDKSGLIKYSIHINHACYSEFSNYVHAALNHLTKRPITEAFDPLDNESLKRFGNAQRKVFQSVLILASAQKPDAIGKLDAIERAWYDWVLGNEQQKKIRAGQFLTA